MTLHEEHIGQEAHIVGRPIPVHRSRRRPGTDRDDRYPLQLVGDPKARARTTGLPDSRDEVVSVRRAHWSAAISETRAPCVREGMESRRDLLVRLIDSGKRLVAVTAPAGYGKTALLDEWARHDRRDVAWISLVFADGTLISMARHIAAACCDLEILHEEEVDAALHDTDDPVQAICRLLHHAIGHAHRPFVIVIDDVHRVTNRSCIELLDNLLDRVPTGSQIVIAGRSEPPFLARRRVQAECVEAQASDLALDATDVSRIFAREAIEVSDVDARAVLERTEGWPAAVYLAALAAKQRAEVGTNSVASRYVEDYLYHSVFEGLPAHLQDFLLDSSVLDTMCASLCDQVLGIVNTQSILEQLERDNLFVVPIDDHRGWYRYHRLFRDFLLGEFRRRRQESDRSAIRHAARWCDAHGSAEQAVEYLLNEPSQLVPLLERVGPITLLNGDVDTVARWLRTAGEPTIEQSPSLVLLAGWTAALSGRAADQDVWADRALDARLDLTHDGHWSSYHSAFMSLRALSCAVGVPQMSTDAETAIELEPISSHWHALAQWVLGQAHELQGDREGAIRAYDDAIHSDDRVALPSLLSYVSRASIAMDSRDWSKAERLMDRAIELNDHIPCGGFVSGMVHTANARLALRRGDVARLDRELAHSMAERSSCTSATPYVAVRVRLVLAELHVMTGDHDTAGRLLSEIDGVVAQSTDLGSLVDDVAHLRGRMSTVLPMGEALTAAQLRVVPYLSTHLTLTEIAAELYVSRHTVRSHAAAIYRKLGASSRREAVALALEAGIG